MHLCISVCSESTVKMLNMFHIRRQFGGLYRKTAVQMGCGKAKMILARDWKNTSRALRLIKQENKLRNVLFSPTFRFGAENESQMRDRWPAL